VLALAILATFMDNTQRSRHRVRVVLAKSLPAEMVDLEQIILHSTIASAVPYPGQCPIS